ncbi:MAG: protein kinase [Kofleriaceae bacterium]|nr:protein kinase [Kofleriaceae bacterium]
MRKLGEGGMGAVWLGEHTLLGRQAAIKVLLPELSANQGIVQRFFNEARAVTSIADPGIVQVFDFGFHADGSAYLVMELLEGEPMDARLRRIRRFSPADALRLMRQIATSLGAAHAKGVIHRDLKPENIFIVGDPAVTGGERPKILDFGIAKLGGDEPGKLKTRTGVLMGTPIYMSPEQCRGASNIDHRSDVYALGCVLFTMLVGHPPFDGEGTGDIIIAHARDAPPVPSTLAPGLTPDLDALVLRCLEKDPAARFQSMAELAQALAAVEASLLHGAGAAPALPARPSQQIPSAPTPPPITYAGGMTPPPVAYAGGATPPPMYAGTVTPPPAYGAAVMRRRRASAVTTLGRPPAPPTGHALRRAAAIRAPGSSRAGWWRSALVGAGAVVIFGAGGSGRRRRGAGRDARAAAPAAGERGRGDARGRVGRDARRAAARPASAAEVPMAPVDAGAGRAGRGGDRGGRSVDAGASSVARRTATSGRAATRTRNPIVAAVAARSERGIQWHVYRLGHRGSRRLTSSRSSSPSAPTTPRPRTPRPRPCSPRASGCSRRASWPRPATPSRPPTASSRAPAPWSTSAPVASRTGSSPRRGPRSRTRSPGSRIRRRRRSPATASRPSSPACRT